MRICKGSSTASKSCSADQLWSVIFRTGTERMLRVGRKVYCFFFPPNRLLIKLPAALAAADFPFVNCFN